MGLRFRRVSGVLGIVYSVVIGLFSRMVLFLYVVRYFRVGKAFFVFDFSSIMGGGRGEIEIWEVRRVVRSRF